MPDEDIDSQDSETQDDDSDSQGSEIVDDSEETPDLNDSDSDETQDESSSIADRYKRCYDEIPDDPYEGFFANPHIESEVKRSLGYEQNYKLKEEDLEKVTEITVYSQDLRGLEKLVNLKKIQISGENVYDFTPLLTLKQLKEVILYSEYMTCLDGSFSLLTNLETVAIEKTEIKDVSPIEQLVNLKSLAMRNNRIEFLPENLGNLQKLEFLSFVHNNVKDIELLNSLISLKELFFHYNHIEDISPIKDLVNVTRLGAQGNQIKDISAVTNLVHLTYLGLNENRIERIPEDFLNLKKLKSCELLYNNISNLPDLKGLDSLDDMWIGSNDLNNEDLMRLDDLETVRFLDVALCKKITKVPVMKNLKSLKELYLNYNSITDLSGFADNESFPALKSVYLGSNKISDAEAFRKRKGLNRLSIGNNCITDLSPLEELKESGTHVVGMNEQLENCEDTTE